MEKPNLFKNENINVDNNLEYTTLKNIEEENNDIDSKLDSIFNSFKTIYNQKVRVTTKEKIFDTYLISRTRNNIMTLKKEIIPIKDIIDLEIK